ncbi:RNA polymerase factor sigma-54 [Tepidibacillus infernus]|uniref:RNA polymerase factor sigma-54 n=1 Tax=Tepidibacillus infernus TaxID=1806172 RepID=UPI003B71BD69
MQLGYGLYQQQTQKLIMTPELRQAITILQFPAIELTEYLHQQIVENPVFDIEDKEMERYEFFYQNSRKSFGVMKADEEEFNIWDRIATPTATLEEYLLEQARFLAIDNRQFHILKFIIGNLDDSGYLTIPLTDLAKQLQVNLSEIEQALTQLHSLEPVGVGARNLQENLLLQLKKMDPIDEKAIKIVSHHLTDLGEKRFQKIAQALGISLLEVQQCADLIKTLNPSPAYGFQNGTARYILPDITIEKIEGEYIVIVNDTLVPRLKINSYYRQYIQTHGQEGEASKYILDKLNAAEWLVKSIEQRRNTLYKVTNAILKYQRQFFETKQLKPLTLKTIAEEIGVHESTVSRATNQKYVQTPIGIFELKYFFNTGVATSSGEVTSAENVKKLIKKVVDGENKQKPLSDQKIVELLQQEGIEISRRTVAKYRDELGILSSSKRKRF